MKITKTNVILLFVELGFANATNWDTAKLTTKINQIADKVDADQDMKTYEGTKLLKQVFGASESGEKIEVTEEEAPKSKKADKSPAKAEKPAKKDKPAPADEEEDEAPAPKAKKGKPAPVEDEEESEEEESEAPKGKSKKPAPAPEADEETEDDEKPAKKVKASKSEGKDRFGNRVASQAGQINAAMSKKIQTVEQIAEATGLSEARVRSHMQYLIGRELAEHVEDKGYRLTK